MRLVFVTGSLVHGGAERHSITLMNRLAEQGHECHAVYVKNDPSQLERIRLRGQGTAVCLNASKYLDFSSLGFFKEHLEKLRPSVVVAANGYALMYATLALAMSGVPAGLVATFHTTRVLGMKEHLKSLIDRPFFWRADCTVFVCNGQRGFWRRRGLMSRRNEVIYNGVDTDHFRPPAPGEAEAARLRLGYAESDYVIGISAVLREEKNHAQLVDALAMLRGRGIPARVMMIGDGPMREAVEARAAERGVRDHVLITGFQQDVRDPMRACDVMVLCSRAVETFSLAALEAMAMGRPVVHAELGGAREMIVPGWNGYLFPVGDTAALAGRLALLGDRALAARLGRRAREVVEGFFSERRMVERYASTLAAISEKKPTGDQHACLPTKT